MPLNSKYNFSANKDWFYEKALKILIPSNSLNHLIPFPEVFKRFSLFFHFTKEESWRFLKELERQKLVEIVPYKGVKIKRR